MEQFHDGHHVWLRSRETRTYLHADDDGRGVSLRWRRASVNAAWAVQVLNHGNGLHYVLLHSAAYGRYLAATTTPSPRGHHGFRVEQRNYDQPEEEDSITWQVVRAGSRNDVLLLNVTGRRYLRANGKYLPWNNGVSVDGFLNFSTMMHWIVVPIPPRLGMPDLPNPVRARLPGVLSGVILRRRAVAPQWQLIRFVRAREDGFYTDAGWTSFHFWGRSVYDLRDTLARKLGVIDHFFDLVMCVRAGRYGSLTPLVVNLPRDGDGDGYVDAIEIVVIMGGTPAANALRHPDVDAV